MVCEKGTTYLIIQDVEMQIINQKVDEIKIRILTWCMDRCSWEWENILWKVYQMEFLNLMARFENTQFSWLFGGPKLLLSQNDFLVVEISNVLL